MNTRLRRAIAVVLAMATTLGASATAHAAPGMEVGLQDDAVFLYQNYYNRDVALQQARQLGVTRLRVNVLWNRIASAQAGNVTPPAQVTYDWAPYDSLVNAAAAYGIKVQFSLAGPAPAWANAKHRNDAHSGAYKPNAYYYGLFAHSVAQHFAGRVDRYSIWNEPNWGGWLAPLKDGPKLYAKLYKAGYTGVKTADWNAKVLFGELAPQEHRGGVHRAAHVRSAGHRPRSLHRGRLRSSPVRVQRRARVEEGWSQRCDAGHPQPAHHPAQGAGEGAQAAHPHRQGAAALPHRVRLLRARAARARRGTPLGLPAEGLPDGPAQPGREGDGPVHARGAARRRRLGHEPGPGHRNPGRGLLIAAYVGVECVGGGAAGAVAGVERSAAGSLGRRSQVGGRRAGAQALRPAAGAAGD